MSWIYRVLALLTWLVAPAFLAWIEFQTHTSTTTTCSNAGCTSRSVTTSEWLTHPAEVAGLLVVVLFLGLLPAGVILWHAGSRSRGSLAALWLLVPFMALVTIGGAFTVVGIVGSFWGVFFFLAAVAGSAETVWHAVSRLFGQSAATAR